MCYATQFINIDLPGGYTFIWYIDRGSVQADLVSPVDGEPVRMVLEPTINVDRILLAKQILEHIETAVDSQELYEVGDLFGWWSLK